MEQIILNEQAYALSAVGKHALRLRAAEATECGLDRYGIYAVPEEISMPNFQQQGDSLLIKDHAGNVLTSIRVEQTAAGKWTVSCSLEDGEQFYGLGDVNRECINRRGHTFRMWVVNVNSYVPIPFLMSSRGWAILVNSTFDHYVDVGDTQKD